MANRSALLFVLLLGMLLGQITCSCHYSCVNCQQQYYSACFSCPNNQSVSLSVTSQKKQTAGTCANTIDSSGNLLGITLLVMVIVANILFTNQNIYYLAFILQTLGLLYFIQVYWIYPLDYILQSFTYLMIFSYITKPIKPTGNDFNEKSSFKAIFYLKTPNLKENLLIIGPLILIIALFLGIIPLFKICRRRLVKGEHSFIPDWLLQKITLALNTAFLFLIQQTTLILSMSLFFSTENQKIDFALLAIYIILVLLYFINICSYPLPFFRNKISQCICIVLKAIAPIFLLITFKFAFFFFIFVTILLFFQTVATNKNPENGRRNKLLLYKFVTMGIFLTTFVHYLIQLLLNQQKGSKVIGIITIIALLISVYMFIFELFLSLRQKFCEQDQTVQVVQQTQQYGLANVTEVQKNFKIYAAERILQNNGVQNGSLHNFNSNLTHISFEQPSFPGIKLKLQPKIDAFAVANSHNQAKPKQLSAIVCSESNNGNNLSESDVCDIFIPQIQNFINQDQEELEKHAVEQNKHPQDQ